MGQQWRGAPSSGDGLEPSQPVLVGSALPVPCSWRCGGMDAGGLQQTTPQRTRAPPGFAVSRGKGEQQHISHGGTYRNVAYCFYFQLSTEDTRVRRAGSLAGFGSRGFGCSPVEEQLG